MYIDCCPRKIHKPTIAWTQRFAQESCSRYTVKEDLVGHGDSSDANFFEKWDGFYSCIEAMRSTTTSNSLRHLQFIKYRMPNHVDLFKYIPYLTICIYHIISISHYVSNQVQISCANNYFQQSHHIGPRSISQADVNRPGLKAMILFEQIGPKRQTQLIHVDSLSSDVAAWTCSATFFKWLHQKNQVTPYSWRVLLKIIHRRVLCTIFQTFTSLSQPLGSTAHVDFSRRQWLRRTHPKSVPQPRGGLFPYRNGRSGCPEMQKRGQ